MKNLSNCLLLLVFLFFFTDCQNKKENSEHVQLDKNIDTISILYYNYLPEIAEISSENLKLLTPNFRNAKKGVLDAMIIDSSKLVKLKGQIDLLKPLSDKDATDVRIKAVIKCKDGSADELLLCGKYATAIYYNGVKQEANNYLVFLIKNYSGYYPWFIGDDLAAMPELSDTTFPKEPFYRDNYYKQYQEMLSIQ